MGNDSVDNLFAVTLVDAGDRRIEVIKAIRSTTGLGLFVQQLTLEVPQYSHDPYRQGS